MLVYDIIGYCFIGLIIIVAGVMSVYTFVYYSHPLDKDITGIWILRILIMIGLTVAILSIFMLPLDYLCAYQVYIKKKR